MNYSDPDITDYNYGFTGHEHLDEFDLINMDGRMYDPVLAMFLSPDPFIQSPETTQNYNRYAYVMNNPLKYTDPTGFSRSAYLEMLMDRYNYEGGGFWYRGTYYSYRSDAGYGGHGGYVASGGPGGSQAIYGQVGYEQTTDYYTAYKDRDGNWVITNYIYSETKQWNEWELVGYTHPPAGGWVTFEQAANGGGNYIQDIWNDFEKIYFPSATNKQKLEHFFKAMKYAFEHGSSTVYLDGIFSSFVYMSSSISQSFKVPPTNVNIGNMSLTVQIRYPTPADKNGRYNSIVECWAGIHQLWLAGDGSWWSWLWNGYGWGVREDGMNHTNFDRLLKWITNK